MARGSSVSSLFFMLPWRFPEGGACRARRSTASARRSAAPGTARYALVGAYAAVVPAADEEQSSGLVGGEREADIGCREPCREALRQQQQRAPVLAATWA